MRKGNFIHTFSGARFYPEDVKPEDFNIEDIAHALSHINRFCGHTKFPYSVGQHSVLCSLIVAPGHELGALLHDAAEAYVADLPTPVKRALPEYMALENNILDALEERFQVDTRTPEIKLADRQMVVTEARVLCHPEVKWYEEPGWPEPVDLNIISWQPLQAKTAFLNRFFADLKLPSRAI